MVAKVGGMGKMGKGGADKGHQPWSEPGMGMKGTAEGMQSMVL